MKKDVAAASRKRTKDAALTLEQIRRRAVEASLMMPTTLPRAIAALGFVQADPIRSPARAQDLILRHRVANYRAGDLERRFKRLGLEEDYLYAYGFMPEEVSRLLHPRPDPQGGRFRPTGLAAEVLAFVQETGTTHPQDLMEQFGKERATNSWGGFSKATTRALHSLHYYGLLRVARRRDGIRIYEAAPRREEAFEARERLRRLLLLVARILAPLPQKGLRPTLGLLARGAPGLSGMHAAVEALLRTGELESGTVDGETYLWPSLAATLDRGATRRKVRFLAPFDPIVWDRRRFEHLWGWDYRFEAYTPSEKRRFGYYAMPLLFGDKVVGWVNLSTAQGRLQVETGFVRTAPKGRDFRRAFDAEVARMEDFLARSRR
ncbi:MAG: DNA glycosylase AlkZ-like family protein [Hyphomicrobiales bacterium]